LTKEKQTKENAVIVGKTFIMNPYMVSPFSLEFVGLALSTVEHSAAELLFQDDGTLEEDGTVMNGMWYPDSKQIVIDLNNILHGAVNRVKEDQWEGVSVSFMFYAILTTTILHEIYHAHADKTDDEHYLHNRDEHERITNEWSREMAGELAIKHNLNPPSVMEEPVAGKILEKIFENCIEANDPWFEIQDNLINSGWMYVDKADSEASIRTYVDMIRTTIKPDGKVGMDYINDSEVETVPLVPEMKTQGAEYEGLTVKKTVHPPVPVLSYLETLSEFNKIAHNVVKAIEADDKTTYSVEYACSVLVSKTEEILNPLPLNKEAEAYVLDIIKKIFDFRMNLDPDDGLDFVCVVARQLTSKLTKNLVKTPEAKVKATTDDTTPTEESVPVNMTEGSDGFLYESIQPEDESGVAYNADEQNLKTAVDVHEQFQAKLATEAATAGASASVMPAAAILPVGEEAMPIGGDEHVPMTPAPNTMPAVSHGLSFAEVQQCMHEVYRRLQQHMFAVCDWHAGTDVPFHNPYAVISTPVDLSMIPNVGKILVSYDYTTATGEKASAVPFEGVLHGSVTDKGNLLYCQCGNIMIADRGMKARATFDEELKTTQCSCGLTGLQNALYALPKYTFYLNLGDGVVRKRICMAVNIHTGSNMAKTARDHQVCWVMDGDQPNEAGFNAKFPFKVIDGTVSSTAHK
jgi:hypothetical protein